MRQLRISVFVLLLMVSMGVAGYVAIADFSPFDALYQTVLTVTTVGFQEVNPLDRNGRIFTIILAVFGVGSVLYLVTAMAGLIVEGELKRDVEAWRMASRIDHLREHLIICGAGRVGVEVARELAQRGERFVIIDADAEAVEEAAAAGWLVIHGDASSNEVLQRAGIERAQALVVAASSDAENTFITLTAKGMQPDLYVLARSIEPQSEAKLRQAGADRVISPTAIAGRRLAVAALHPAVVEFAESMLGGQGTGEVLAQVDVRTASPWDGATLAEVLAGRPDVHVLGVRYKDGHLGVAPSSDSRIGGGDVLMVYGRTKVIEELTASEGV